MLAERQNDAFGVVVDVVPRGGAVVVLHAQLLHEGLDRDVAAGLHRVRLDFRGRSEPALEARFLAIGDGPG